MADSRQACKSIFLHEHLIGMGGFDSLFRHLI